jgi:predicted membrane-bound mannosyltransferase
MGCVKTIASKRKRLRKLRQPALVIVPSQLMRQRWPARHAAVPLLVGAAVGLAAGVLFGRAARSLLFEIVRATRIDPAAMLRIANVR